MTGKPGYDRGSIDSRWMKNPDMEEVLARCQPEQWKAAGWAIIDGPACQRSGHCLVEVHVGVEIGQMCGRCGRVYLTGRIDERLAKYAASRQQLKEVS